MKARLFFLFTALCTTFAFGQSSKLFDAYKIPTFSYYTLQVSGQDFLSYLKNKVEDNNQDNERITIQGALSGKYFRQSPLYSGFSDINLGYNYQMEKSKQLDYTSSLWGKYVDVKSEHSYSSLKARSYNDFYLGNEKGTFAFCNLAGSYEYQTPSKSEITLIECSAGAGYGRIVTLRSVVQAYILGKETGFALSDEDIQKLSEIIERKDNGYYSKFRDNADIELCKDITDVTKKPDQITKVQQVFNSALYKTAERMSGWRVRAGINYFHAGGYNYYPIIDNLTDFQIKAEYAYPVGFNMQVYLSAGYSHNLEKGPFSAPKANFSGRFAIDHSYNWSSSLDFGFKSLFPADEVEKTNFNIGLTTNLVVLNSLSLYSTLSYNKFSFYDSSVFGQDVWIQPYYYPSFKTERTEFHLGFRYYIL